MSLPAAGYDGCPNSRPAHPEHRPAPLADPPTDRPKRNTMSDRLVEHQVHHDGLAELRLDRPAARNALSLSMFDAFDTALLALERSATAARVLLLHGAGPAFCAGFDLAAAVDQPDLMATYVHRLSAVNRRLRRLPMVVVAAVQGAAVAGGCALLGPCDFVFVERTARLGYPAHRLGISPAVTIPTLRRSVGDGPARELLLGGQLIDGLGALRCGIASHLVDAETGAVEGLVPGRGGTTAALTPTATDVDPEEPAAVRAARSWIRTVLLAHGPRALLATKDWLNTLEGADRDEPFDLTASASASLCNGSEAVTMLRDYWARLGSRRTPAAGDRNPGRPD